MFDWISKLFSASARIGFAAQPIDRLLHAIASIVKSPHLIEPQMRKLYYARSSDDGGVSLAKAYTEVEKIILSNRPPVVDALYTIASLREHLRATAEGISLPPDFGLIFLPEKEQQQAVYEKATRKLIAYIADYAGAAQVRRTLYEALGENPLKEAVRGETIDFEFLRTLTAPLSGADVLAAYRTVYGALYGETVKLFGQEKAIELCEEQYSFFKDTYDSGITSHFLALLPEGVLDLERLAFMSREELERQIQERTEELHELNASLEKKVAERTEELRQKNERLLELDKLKTEFISVAAHQLRTPLSGIRWTLSLLRDKEHDISDEQRRLLGLALESTTRMNNLVNDLLSASRIESDKVHYEFLETDIGEVIESVRTEFADLATGKKLALEFERSPALPKVSIDKEKIRAVLSNLVENAIRYTPGGGTIAIHALEVNGSLEISVRDSGIGIPKSEQTNIFVKFFRAGNAVRTFTDGSGLGLFVAKHIVEDHGGKIWFESEEGKGTVFTFSLPLQGAGAVTHTIPLPAPRAAVQ